MPNLIILIGPPGSGKSYFTNVLKDKGYEIQSSDAIREKLFGDENDQQKPWLVFKILHENLIKGLNAGKNEVYDACNTNKSTRKSIFKTLRTADITDVHIVGVLMDTPKSVCIERDKTRSRTVGEEVIERMYDDLSKKPPSIDEGFDELLTAEEFKTKYL